MMGQTVSILQERANNLASLNEFLTRIQPPARRKRAILALWESDVISDTATELLIQHHRLEAA